MTTTISSSANNYLALTGKSANTLTASPTLADTLATTGSTSAENAYTLDLSAGALAYIQQIHAAAASNPTTQGFSSDTITSFALTPAQENTLNTILAKYKDAPFTQDTFTQIQADLSAAGITENALSAQSKAHDFNPTQFFLNALTGTGTLAIDNASGLTNTTSDADHEKFASFLKSVVAAWAKISTTVDTATAEA